MSQNKMTKIDLVESVFTDTNVERKAVQEVVDSLLEKIKDALKNGSTIELRGFGTFELRVRKGREKARNPKTGEKVSVASHTVAIFRPGKDLKSAVWNLQEKND